MVTFCQRDRKIIESEWVISCTTIATGSPVVLLAQNLNEAEGRVIRQFCQHLLDRSTVGRLYNACITLHAPVRVEFFAGNEH